MSGLPLGLRPAPPLPAGIDLRNADAGDILRSVSGGGPRTWFGIGLLPD